MDEEDVAFYRWYGPWAPLRPVAVAELFAGLRVPWWIVGGWAIEAFIGRSREARSQRPKDEGDLDAVLPKLDPGHRTSLHAMVEIYHPGHPWLERIRS